MFNFVPRVLIVACLFSFACALGAKQGFVNTLGIRMIYIPPGEFLMGESNEVPSELGGPSYSPNGDWDEQPVHRVVITEGFYVSETPVTQAAFRQFREESTGVDYFYPYVTGVSWYEATAFAEWLSEKEGRTYRLPTEAEWEYFARAGSETLFSAGDLPAQRGERNAWGVAELGVGIPEWCHDWYGRYPARAQVDPVGPESGVSRVVRGAGVELRDPWTEEDESLPRLGFKGSRWLAPAPYFGRSANRASMLPQAQSRPGRFNHYIGFRVVAGDFPETEPRRAEKQFVRSAIVQKDAASTAGPDPEIPYFRARDLLPIPPENDQGGGIEAAGIDPAVMPHIHSGAIVSMPNGDLVQVSFTASARLTEGEPNTRMVISRLRRGSATWDMPELFYNLADSPDMCAILWNDHGTVWFVGGGTYNFYGDMSFKFMTTEDSGATWSPIKLPDIPERNGYMENQPINSMFRSKRDNTIYFGADGKGPTSLLWASKDNGQTWFDTGGRTAGRHTTFVELKDGGILGLGGKNSNINGFMPVVRSYDGGRTWSEAEKTPFRSLRVNQRPVVLRLQSGRLFFASDFQDSRFRGLQEGLTETGAFVALSEDEGKTWHMKRLDLALPHESTQIENIKRNWGDPNDFHDFGTIGYAAATQSPNGVIHLLTSMNHPSQHFEMNEAWILSDHAGESNPGRAIDDQAITRMHKEFHEDGSLKRLWESSRSDNGDYMLHGEFLSFYEDGRLEYQATYHAGVKTGLERLWDTDGSLLWKWHHKDKGKSVWTQYWETGKKRVQSTWIGMRCEGKAYSWAPDGTLLEINTFRNGLIVETVRTNDDSGF